MEKKIRQRLMMQQTCQQQMAFKEMRRQAEKEEEEAFRRMMMAKFAEDDRLEQMNAQKRRMKQLEHKREVEELLEDRRLQREADLVRTSSHQEWSRFTVLQMYSRTSSWKATGCSKRVVS